MACPGPAFGPEPSRTDWLLLNLMQVYQVQGQNEFAANLAESIGAPAVTSTFAGTAATPGMVVADVPGLLLVSLTGTTTPQQWALHLLASPQVAVPGLSGKVNNYFAAAAFARFGDLAPLLRGRPNASRLVFAGHSFGAAMAQIMADLANRSGFTNVACFVAGCPKVGDQDFAAAVGPLLFRLEDSGDPVVVIPPDTAIGLTSWYGIPLVGPAAYAHGGEAQTLAPDGSLSEGSSPLPLVDAAALFAASPAAFAANHVSPTYVERLALKWGGPEFLTPGACGYADPGILQRAAGLSPLVVAPPLPAPDPDPGPPPGGARALALPDAKVGPAYRIHMRFNEGIYGWSEDYYLWYSALGPDAWAVASADARELATARRGILSTQASLWGYRLQQWGGPDAAGSEFVTSPARGPGPGVFPDAGKPVMGGEPVWDGVVCLVYDATFTYRRNLILRGIVSDWLKWSVNGDPALVPPGDSKVFSFLIGMMGKSQPALNPLGLTGSGAMYGRARSPDLTGELVVAEAALNPSGCGTDIYTLFKPETNGKSWQPGDAVHLHQKGGCGVQCHVPGLTGDTCVVAGPFDPVPPSLLFKTTVAARPCCCLPGGTISLPAGTTIRQVVKGFYLMTNADTGRLVKRETGRAGGAARGRARSCTRT